MVVFYLDQLEVFFPYEHIYPEQYAYMKYLKKTLDSEGHCVLEMPTGTGKTVTIFSLITSYQYAKHDDGKFIYCTRTVAEMEKSLIELKKVINYRTAIIKKRKERAQEKLNEEANKKQIKEEEWRAGDTYKEKEGERKSEEQEREKEKINMNKIKEVEENAYIKKEEHIKEDDNKSNSGSNSGIGFWDSSGFGTHGEILAIGVSARRCMCVNDKVLEKHDREKIDAECRRLTANFIREKKYLNYKLNQMGNPTNDAVSEYLIRNKRVMEVEDYFNHSFTPCEDSINEFEEFGLCGYYENMKKEFVSELIKPGVYTMEELKTLCKNYKNKENRNAPICPYFSAKKFIEISKVIVLNYQYVIDPKVTKSTILGQQIGDTQHKKKDIIVFDEAHNIDSVCLEALSVNIDRTVLNKATLNIKNLLKKIEHSKSLNEEKLREECSKILRQIRAEKGVVTKAENGINGTIKTNFVAEGTNRNGINGLNGITNNRGEENVGGNKGGRGSRKDSITYDQECANEYLSWANEELSGNSEMNLKKEKENRQVNGTVPFTSVEKKNNLQEHMFGHLNNTHLNNTHLNNNNLNNNDLNNNYNNNNNNLNKKRKRADIDFDDNMSIIFVNEDDNSPLQNTPNKQNPINTTLFPNMGNDNVPNEKRSDDLNSMLTHINELLDEEKGSDVEFNPVLIENVVKTIMPGNIRKSEHFLNLMRIIVVYLKQYINVFEVTSEGPLSFLYKCEKETKLDTSFFKYCFDRLRLLLNTLQIVNIDEYSALHVICNFCTLLGNYFKGFVIICEPYPEATGIYDPIIQFACLDSSIAMKYVLLRYKSVILTSATISPLELYPKLLNFKTVLTASFPMSFDRKCVCPLIVTRSSDLVPLSSQYSLRNDMNVIKNYGILLYEMCKNIPDGIVAYFPSYIYMEQVIFHWYEMGIITNILKYKLIFLETKDIVATTLALRNFKKACDLGKGAVFLSICRGKIAEGIDFDRHYGKCVILFGIPYQYTLSKILKSRLDFLKETYNIEENEFLTFDAMRQASQCAGRIIRNKKDYGIMIFSDIRYSRNDKKNKLPPWIIKCMDLTNVNLTVSTAVSISKQFLLSMSQQYKETDQTRLSQSLLLDQKKCWSTVKIALNMDDLV